MPFNRKLYPSNWNAIAKAVKEAANWQCVECGVKHGTWREKGTMNAIIYDSVDVMSANKMRGFGNRVGDLMDVECYKVVMTVAHVDNDPGNNEPENLRCLCAACHNRMDIAFRAQNKKLTWSEKRNAVSRERQLSDLFEETI